MKAPYKIKTEIKDFILEQKKANSALSCRSLVVFVQNEFQIKMSKSSINSIIKEAGLSMPVGRRGKKRRRKVKITPKIEIMSKIQELSEEKKLLSGPAALPQLQELSQSEPVSILAPEPVIEPQIQVQVTPKEWECSGAILLKAADYLLGGSHYIAQAIHKQLNRREEELLAKTECLIYLSLFDLSQEAQAQDYLKLCGLINCFSPSEKAYPVREEPVREMTGFKLDELLSYLNELQEIKTINSDIREAVLANLQEARCVKITLADNSSLYLDGQLHTVWSTPHIPHNFSTTLYNIRSYINNYFYEYQPFVFFTAPGYDIPTNDFFNLLLSLDFKGKKITQLNLYNDKFEELEIISFNQAKKHLFVFGLWPWQFVEYRKVQKIGEFKPFYSAMLDKEFYIAQIEIDLSQPNINQIVTLKGCALKTSPTEKTRLLILSNLSEENVQFEELADIYLSHWPNLEEAFQDFSRKIELFTYTGSSYHPFSLAKSGFGEVKAAFNSYLELLDLYVRRYFLPAGYESRDFLTAKKQFYDLNVILSKEKNRLLATFKPPSGYQFLKELEYACRRINEREIAFGGKEKLWCRV